MRNPFSTKGEVSERQMILDLVQEAEYGVLFTWEDFAEALGRDVRDNLGPVYEANKVLLQSEKYLLNVRGVGYKIADPEEHEVRGKYHQKKARSQVRKGSAVVKGANRSRLSVDQQQSLARLDSHLDNQGAFLRRKSAVDLTPLLGKKTKKLAASGNANPHADLLASKQA